MSFETFENLSRITNIGVTVLNVHGEMEFISSVHRSSLDFIQILTSILSSTEADQIALIYGCYQARRFGGRYIFMAPSGLAYCAAPLNESDKKLRSSAVAGPFLLTDHEDYLAVDVTAHTAVSESDLDRIKSGISAIPCLSPARTHAMSEQLFICASYHSIIEPILPTAPKQTYTFPYPLDKEDKLLAAISTGDVNSASALLNDILGQLLFHSSSNLEVLRSRAVELSVLLSRAALKGGADPAAIFGLNYAYLREIDELSSIEELLFWLHGATRRFARHVFDYAHAKHADIIYKAMTFIRKNYAEKITLQDIANDVYLNVTYFSKIFKEETGQTPGNYIAFIRIEESKKLLQDSSVNMVDIPELVGFEGQSYFTQVFKKTEGCTPWRYRKKHLEKEQQE